MTYTRLAQYVQGWHYIVGTWHDPLGKSPLPGKSHKAALTIATTDLWFPAQTASRMEGGRQIKNLPEKSRCLG